MSKQKEARTIQVAGDITIDWNIARLRYTESAAQTWTAEDITHACCQLGGVAMLAELIDTIAKNLLKNNNINYEIQQVNMPPGRISPTDSRFHHSYAIWSPFKLDERRSDSEKVWRVQEFLGLNPVHIDIDTKNRLKKVENDAKTPDIIVLDDANLGFRENPDYWPKALMKNKVHPWILIKMAKPVAQGKLWEHLYQNFADRLIVVMTAADLRSSQVQISRQISWERTAQDLVWELSYNRHVNTLAQCSHVIVSFGTAGAILLSRNSKSLPEAVLFFDPVAMEGEWGRQYRGSMGGYNTCLAASIVRELMLPDIKPEIHRGIQSGIRGMRFLHEQGYGCVNNNESQIHLAFPASKIAEVLAKDDKSLPTVTVSSPIGSLPTSKAVASPADTTHFWTILEDKHPGSLEVVAEQIVYEGLENALPEVPMGRFGNLKTVDRREIESLHSISSLIHDYCQRYRPTPLSIAVFGPPGSGKSYAIKEVASSVRPGEIEALNFNLSQFADPEELYNAFHRVRDKALSGKIPLVFWDEFDASLQHQPLGWLRYFLAPMQDGEFQEGQIIHPIGRSIFVFAGGTSESIETFGVHLEEKERRAIKLPDFVSRLKGFLNILGPNRQKSGSPTGQDEDPYYIIRRAIILRSDFERFAPQIFRNEGQKRIVNIDPGVLRTFLLTKEYRHGARSIEAIIAMSQLAGKTRFERSCLPSEAQLDLHVDGHDFFAIMQHLEINSYMVEELAEAVHEVFCEDMKAKGYIYGPVTDDKKKRHNSFLPYVELSEDEKEQNRSNARDIQNKLASIGYEIVPARGNQTPAKFTSEEVEKLAKVEHKRWIKQKLTQGWKYANKSDKAKKEHRDILPWEQLSKEVKDKDRVLVRGIPRILGKAGYTMAKQVEKNRHSSKK